MSVMGRKKSLACQGVTMQACMSVCHKVSMDAAGCGSPGLGSDTAWYFFLGQVGVSTSSISASDVLRLDSRQTKLLLDG